MLAEVHKQISKEWNKEPSLYIFVFLIFILLVTCHFLKKFLLRSDNDEYNGVQRGNFPPGSRAMVPLLGETLQFLAAIYSNQGFYKFVLLRHLCKPSLIFVSSTEAAKEILSNDLGRFTKKYMRSIGEVIGRESVLSASPQTHKLIRRELLDLFSSASVAEFIKHFDQIVVSTISGWAHRPKVMVLDDALEMTLKAMCKMLLSLEGEHDLNAMRKDVTCVCQAMLAFPFNFPGTRFSKGLKARKRIMGMLDSIIQKRREADSTQNPAAHDHKDSLGCLLQAMNQEKCSVHQAQQLTDTQIKDNILTMIIAGQDTTASAIAWMVKYLDENQGVLQALQDELHSLNKKVGRKPCLTLDDLNYMTYASKVVKESMRMASIVPWFPRVALHDCKIQGYTIKKGWNINVDARSIHLDPTIYTDPNIFNPSRFDDEARPYSFLAFGAGGRTCIGMSLAKAMMLVFLFRLVTTYKWKVTDPDPSVAKWAMFSRLRSGCPIEITHVYD